MESNKNLCFFTFLLLFLKSSSLVQSSNTTQSLDVLLHDHAFKALVNNHTRPRTGALYDASLPASLAGMKLSVVRLRSRTLWRKGANFSHFHIPPKTLPVPYVHRLIIVYHDLGNWSSVYFNVSGYSMMSPVVGFMAYDSDFIFRNLSRLEFNTTREPISVQFKGLNAGIHERTKCAIFNGRGEVSLSSIEGLNICYTRGSLERLYVSKYCKLADIPGTLIPCWIASPTTLLHAACLCTISLANSGSTIRFANPEFLCSPCPVSSSFTLKMSAVISIKKLSSSPLFQSAKMSANSELLNPPTFFKTS
nr:uncharacterized protein LOC109148254 [Ipomoea batatas]